MFFLSWIMIYNLQVFDVNCVVWTWPGQRLLLCQFVSDMLKTGLVTHRNIHYTAISVWSLILWLGFPLTLPRQCLLNQFLYCRILVWYLKWWRRVSWISSRRSVLLRDQSHNLGWIWFCGHQFFLQELCSFFWINAGYAGIFIRLLLLWFFGRVYLLACWWYNTSVNILASRHLVAN